MGRGDVLGKSLIIAGAAILAVGLLITFWPGALGWFGKLPGDIHVERGSTRVWIPITSMLVVSLVLSALGSFLLRR